MLAIMMGLALQAAPPMPDEIDMANVTPVDNDLPANPEVERRVQEARDTLFLLRRYVPSIPASFARMNEIKTGGRRDGEWVEVGGSKTSITMLRVKDIQSTRTVGNVWAKLVFNKPDPELKNAKTAITKDRIDCANETIMVVAIATYGTDGAIIDNTTFSTTADPPKPVVPDSVAESEMKAVCAAQR